LSYFVVYNTGVRALSQDDLIIDVKKIIDRKEDIRDKEIIYTIVTRGLNINSVEGGLVFFPVKFIKNSRRRVYGCGIILYPQNWKNKITFVGELARSSDDYRILISVKIFDTAIFGFHGSHFMCRADAEKTVGWDFGECKAEDLVFIIKMHERFKKVAAIMRGFAYEKPPFTVGDHLKQRRRWFLGAFGFMKKDDKLKLISNAMLSILLESFAPWYALFKRTPSYEVIKKDREN
jgi:cellulose synthase/poly-beta-1,6-N-acetylglucosamine synthase-like glycosyltransferase